MYRRYIVTAIHLFSTQIPFSVYIVLLCTPPLQSTWHVPMVVVVVFDISILIFTQKKNYLNVKIPIITQCHMCAQILVCFDWTANQ